MANQPRVLILDDDKSARETLERIVKRRLVLEGKSDVAAVATFDEAATLIDAAGDTESTFDALFLDLADTVAKDVPGRRVIEKLTREGRTDLLNKTVVLSAYVSTSGEQEWLRAGLPNFPTPEERRRWDVFDILSKPPDEYIITRILEYLCKLPRRPPERAKLNVRATVNDKKAFGRIAGVSASLRSALELALLVAQGDSRVLILGESGTGKEEFARALHMLSERTGKFKGVNLAAIPETLWEAEFFGTRKGAATNIGDRTGYFEYANHGTLFLDEIGEMTPATQTKLLRVLEEKEVSPVGKPNETIKLDVRIIAATDRSMDELRDVLDDALYWRLAGEAVISLPSLKERLAEDEDELDTILAHELERIGEDESTYPDFHVNLEDPLSLGARKILQKHEWPGNYRTFVGVLNSIARRLRGRPQITTVDVLDALVALPSQKLARADMRRGAVTRSGGAQPAAELLKEVCAELQAEGAWRNGNVKDRILDRARFRVFEAMLAEGDGDLVAVARKYQFGADDDKAYTNIRKTKERLSKAAGVHG